MLTPSRSVHEEHAIRSTVIRIVWDVKVFEQPALRTVKLVNMDETSGG